MATSQAIPMIHAQLTEAKNRNWDNIHKFFEGESLDCLLEFIEETDEHEKTILHHACEILSSENATQEAEWIISTLEDKGITQDSMRKFLDTSDKEGRTALHIAAFRQNLDLVEYLIVSGADVNRPGDAKNNEAVLLILGKAHRALTSFYSAKISVKKNAGRLENDLAWEVDCDFSAVTGIPEKGNAQVFRQTKILARVLRQKRSMVTAEILLHPLVHIFLLLKIRKFRCIIYTSIALHTLWYILCIIYFRSVYREKINPSEYKATGFRDDMTGFLGTFFDVLIVLFYISLPVAAIKELLEYICSPDKSYYVRQPENHGQWYVVIFSVLTLVIPNGAMNNWIAVIGIFLSSLLTQSQLTKFECLGLYAEMLYKGMKNLLKFLFVFSPILASFALTFHILIPTSPGFAFPEVIVKSLAMMTGEITYNEIFYTDCAKVPTENEVITKIITGLFIICVVLMLHNFLIGLTVSNIQELERKAKESYLASQLELIYIIEAFVMRDFKLNYLKNSMWLKHVRDGLLVKKEDSQRTLPDGTIRNKRLGEYPVELWDALRKLQTT